MSRVMPQAHRAIAEYHHLFPIGLGAMPLSLPGKPTEKEAIKVILRFLEIGGNFIDTADVYGLDDSDRGHNEKLLAKAIKEYGQNAQLLIASKGGASRPQGGWALGGGHPDKLRRACEQSLKNLQIETHQLYYLHGPDPKVPLADSLGALAKLKEEGKIQNLGIANVDLSQLEFAHRLTPLAAVQNRFNPFCKGDFQNGVIEFCSTHQLTYVPYCPLGGWADHQKLAQHSSFQEIALKYEVSTYVLSLAWALQKAPHILPIPGMDKCEHVSINKEAVNLILTAEDLHQVDKLPDLFSPKHVDPE